MENSEKKEFSLFEIIQMVEQGIPIPNINEYDDSALVDPDVSENKIKRHVKVKMIKIALGSK